LGRARVTAAIVVPAAIACAISEAPSGGPEDRAPPAVVATVPAADSTGVDPSSPIEITFGESMTRARVERLVAIQPPITLESAEWRGRTLVIKPQGGLVRDTTYVVLLKPGYRDRHGVTATQPREFAFATGASLDTASISGQVLFRRQPSGKAVVRCFRVPRDTTFVPEAARPDRETTTGQDGGYRLRYLPSNDARFVVMAFQDQNGNGAFDRPGEPFTVLADTVLLAPMVPRVDDIQIAIVDPTETATVSGVVVNETGIDSVFVSVGLFALVDSTRAARFARCDSAGAYTVAKVPAGAYRLRAFLDLKADSTCGEYECGEPPCLEPCATLPDTLTLAPGASLKVERKLVLRRREGTGSEKK
jgi:uncharacterized protein (DUF2141 family)